MITLHSQYKSDSRNLMKNILYLNIHWTYVLLKKESIKGLNIILRNKKKKRLELLNVLFVNLLFLKIHKCVDCLFVFVFVFCLCFVCVFFILFYFILIVVNYIH